MSRRTIIITATLIALIVGIIPIITSIWYSYRQTFSEQTELMQSQAKETADQIALLINKIDVALRPLQNIPMDCSEETQEKMSAVEYALPEIRIIGLLAEDGKLICTSRGLTAKAQQERYDELVGKPGLQIIGPIKNPLVPYQVMIISSTRADNTIVAAIVLPQTLRHFLTANIGPDGFIALARKDIDQAFAIKGNKLRQTRLKDLQYLDDNTSISHAEFSDKKSRTLISAKVPNTQDLFVTLAVTNRWLLNDWYKLAAILVTIAMLISTAFILLVVMMTKRRLSFHNELERAVKKQELQVYYQPVIDLQKNKCIGAEALLRWHHPQRDIIRPDIFIPLAEDNGMIVPITEWLIKQIIKELGPILKSNKDLHIAINLCPNHFENDAIVNFSQQYFAESGIDFHQIIYEITERTLIPDKDELPRKIMEKLKAQEANLALDDFGTGYSSLSYLNTFPFDYIKIDKQFTESIGTGAITEQLVDSIINMASKLNHAIIAEGIETKVQAEYLTKNGVELGQGWYYAKPLQIAEFLAFMVNYNQENKT